MTNQLPKLPTTPAPVQPPATPVQDSVSNFFNEAAVGVKRGRRTFNIVVTVAIVGLVIYATKSHGENLKWRESAQGIMGLIEQL